MQKMKNNLGQKMNTKEYHLGRLLQKVGSYDANFRDTLQCICKIWLLRKAHGEGAFVGQHANEACVSICTTNMVNIEEE